MSQPTPATSKTAKKRASPTPVKIPDAAGVASAPILESNDTEEKTGVDVLAVKPTLSCKRRIRRQFEIPRVTFRRLVHEIASDYHSDLRFQRGAYDALQEASETLISERFARCSQLVDLCKLDTVRDEHWRFVQGEHGAVPCSGMS